MYSPTAISSNAHSNDLIANDASAQQSQQAPLVVNTTQAAERWDGKSKLLKYLEPVVDKIRSVVDPIANVFYTMPTFRGLNSDISTAVVETEIEKPKRPREILIPQPRNIAQRKMTYRKSPRHRPKKFVEFKVDLDKLKYNKDFLDYIKTKKYKHNYPQTYYYPRIKYFINPNSFAQKPNNNRLLPYPKPILWRNLIPIHNNLTATTPSNIISLDPSDWKPIIMVNKTESPKRINKRDKKRRKKLNKKRRKRVRRSVFLSDTKDGFPKRSKTNSRKHDEELSIASLTMNNTDDFIYQKVIDYFAPTKKPAYYTITYNMLMSCLDIIDGIFEVHEVIYNYFNDDVKQIKKSRKKNKKKKPYKILAKNVTSKAKFYRYI